MMGPVMDKLLNHYMITFPYPSIIKGQHTEETFTLDYRNTKSPFISEKGFIDIFLSGEIIYDKKDCGDIKHKPM